MITSVLRVAPPDAVMRLVWHLFPVFYFLGVGVFLLLLGLLDARKRKEARRG